VLTKIFRYTLMHSASLALIGLLVIDYNLQSFFFSETLSIHTYILSHTFTFDLGITLHIHT